MSIIAASLFAALPSLGRLVVQIYGAVAAVMDRALWLLAEGILVMLALGLIGSAVGTLLRSRQPGTIAGPEAESKDSMVVRA